jgi:catechol 2,3-dioxygenase-like lactoylglutathione lyase family enzyme
MRIDHIAYRVADRKKTAKFFIEAMGYRIQQEFEIDFGDDQKAKCLALEPPEKKTEGSPVPWIHEAGDNSDCSYRVQSYHMPPELFVSDGTPGSIVGDWVAARGGIGGIHHIAYQVESVEKVMEEWKTKGYAEFTSDKPMECPGLKQCFTKPSALTGVIYEFIERGEHGFCTQNVKSLMLSTKDM